MANLNIAGDTKSPIIIKSCLDLIHAPGEVIEVRIPKARGGTLSGYFDDTTKAALYISRESGRQQAIYATVNPVKPELLARMQNKLSISQVTTSDAEIEKRRWFLLDFDPIRPTGISSTDGEWDNARLKADEVAQWLASIGWPEPLQASSGNGWHLMYRVDEPNDSAARTDFEFATKMLSSLFSDDKTNIDTSVSNAARIWKVYGTLSMKGSSTVDRPHRVASIQGIPNELLCVSRALIENVARPLRDSNPDEFKDMAGDYISDIVKWLSDRGQTITSGPRPMFGSEGQKWIISRCPFDPSHKEPMVGLIAGRPVYRCLHNSCSTYKWREYREKIDPTYRDPDVVYARVKEWCEGDTPNTDKELLQSLAMLGSKTTRVISRLMKEVPRPRVAILENDLKIEKRNHIKNTVGENNEKGNVVGLINRIRVMQSHGDVPVYWTASYDHRVRKGDVGDISSEKLTDTDEINLMVKFHGVGDTWVKQIHTSQVIKVLAEERRVNPLAIYMNKKRWDGEKRLDTWLSAYMATLNDEYTRAIGRKWMISAVARAVNPGCQVDHMLIFEGKQGVGKSRAARVIGGDFYCEYSGNLTGANADRDLVAVIIGKMVVEMSELATMRKSEINSLKSMLTKCIDDVRLSYERDAKSYPRTCVFIGTTNDIRGSYIADETGARRFWPCVVGETGPIEIDLLRRDIDQLWAEAVEAYNDGEDWYTIPKEATLYEQSSRQMLTIDSDPWADKIRSALTDPDNYGTIFHVVNKYQNGQLIDGFAVRAGATDVVLGQLLGIDIGRQSEKDATRLKRVLISLGFGKVRPAKQWYNKTYAYDLNKNSPLEHLWSSIEAAKNSVKFKKPTKNEQH